MVIESSIRPHHFFVAIQHQNTPAIVSTTGDSALENVALAHTPVRSAEGHILRNDVTLGKPKHHQNQVTTKRKNHKQVQVFEWKVVLLPKLRQPGWTIGFKGYDGGKRKCLVKGFKVSFRIPFAGQRSCRLSGNATSVTKNLDILNFRLRLTTKELQVLLR